MYTKDHRPVKPQAQPDLEPEAPPYDFSLREIGRLAVYRAAVLSGFYNEQLDEATDTDSSQ
jgi:hypothetical protein